MKGRITATVKTIQHPDPQRAVDVLARIILREILKPEKEDLEEGYEALIAGEIEAKVNDVLTTLKPSLSWKKEGEKSMDTLPQVLTIKDVSQYLRRSTKTVRDRIKSGEIRSYKEGQAYRIRREWMLEYEARLVAARGAPSEPAT